MKIRLEPEAGDVVTVRVPQREGGLVYMNAVVHTVPAADRFTFRWFGELIEASPEHVVAYRGVGVAAMMKEEAA